MMPALVRQNPGYRRWPKMLLSSAWYIDKSIPHSELKKVDVVARSAALQFAAAQSASGFNCLIHKQFKSVTPPQDVVAHVIRH
jgi:hypothetical protein